MLCDGKAPRGIVIALGIDPDILGDNRIAGLKAIVKREVTGVYPLTIPKPKGKQQDR